MLVPYSCPYCWQENESELYAEDGLVQELVEDCRVCCQPMHLTARYDAQDDTFSVIADREAGD